MNKLKFTNTQLSDLPAIMAMEQLKGNAQFITPDTLEKHTSLIKDSNILHLLIHKSENNLVGFVILAGLEDRNGEIEFRRIVIQKKGRGLGRLTIRLIKDHCFVNHNAKRLWLDVLASNARAIHLYKSEGFKETEILLKALEKDGKLQDLVIMAISHNEYKSKILIK